MKPRIDPVTGAGFSQKNKPGHRWKSGDYLYAFVHLAESFIANKSSPRAEPRRDEPRRAEEVQRQRFRF